MFFDHYVSEGNGLAARFPDMVGQERGGAPLSFAAFKKITVTLED
jgi:hypothetical protein